jgi:hypothetical protein
MEQQKPVTKAMEMDGLLACRAPAATSWGSRAGCTSRVGGRAREAQELVGEAGRHPTALPIARDAERKAHARPTAEGREAQL